jgi:hypothetical protein
MSLPTGTTIAQALAPQFLHNLPMLKRLETLLNRPDTQTEYSIEELCAQLQQGDSLGDVAQLLSILVQGGYFQRCYRVMAGSVPESEYGSLLEVPEMISIEGVSRPMQVDDLKILYRRLAAASESGT